MISCNELIMFKRTSENCLNQASNSLVFQGPMWFKPQYRASIRSLPWRQCQNCALGKNYRCIENHQHLNNHHRRPDRYKNLTREHIFPGKLEVLLLHKWHCAHCWDHKATNHLVFNSRMPFMMMPEENSWWGFQPIVKGLYLKISGQKFWFTSTDANADFRRAA